MVCGVRILVIEEIVVVVTGFSTTRETWFSRKPHLPEAQKGFLVDDEQVQTKG
jgi:hypothetical protein